MPPNTILLSQMMRELSAQPGFREKLLAQINGDAGSRRGPALLTPKLFDELHKRVLGEDWSGLDRFPGWTMAAVTPSVDAVEKVPGKGAQPFVATNFLDVGPYALDKEQTASPNDAASLPGITTQGIVSDLGNGVVHGDGPNALASEHQQSRWLAYVLNRLAANALAGVKPASIHVWAGVVSFEGVGVYLDRPEAVMTSLLATGHTITVTDSRYFANFTHLHYNGQDVMAPFWLDPEIEIPNAGGRRLLVPVAHAELEWHIRGPMLNADVSYYFGDDGKSEWRVMDTLDQPWVMKRDAHTWSGKDAVEVTRLAGLLTAAYLRLHAAHPELPFGGYFTLGVCQDGVAAIEKKMTGAVTLYPNTADDRYFTDARDAEVNAMMAAIPKDRDGRKPEAERVFGSLPLAPAADVDHAFDAVSIPGLAADLNATYAAWKAGTLERTFDWRAKAKAFLFLGSAIGVALFAAWKTRRFLDRDKYELVQRNPYKK